MIVTVFKTSRNCAAFESCTFARKILAQCFLLQSRRLPGYVPKRFGFNGGVEFLITPFVRRITWQIYFGYRRVKPGHAFAKANSRPKLWYAPVSSGSIHGNHKLRHGSIWRRFLP